MKIPTRKTLKTGTIGGGFLVAFGTIMSVWCTYWLARRDQLDGVIECGKNGGKTYSFYRDGEKLCKVRIETTIEGENE